MIDVADHDHLPKVEEKWRALRFLAGVHAFMAWLLAIAVACYFCIPGLWTLVLWEPASSKERLIGLVMVAAGLLGGILVWAVLMAAAQFIYLAISIEEHTRVLVALAARSEVDVRQ